MLSSASISPWRYVQSQYIIKSKTHKKQQGANLMHSQIIYRQRFIHRVGVRPQNIQRQICLVQSNDLSTILASDQLMKSIIIISSVVAH